MITNLILNSLILNCERFDTFRRIKWQDLSGKTGTSVINGELHAGWFVGYVETAENTFFCCSFQGEKRAAGSSAAEIALSILDKKGIYPSASR